MTLNSSMLALMEDRITIEPYTGTNSQQAPTYGTAVTYQAQVLPFVERVILAGGREVRSTTSVIIPDRLFIDQRSRITLPAGIVPQQPPILGVQPLRGLALDHTRILLSILLTAAAPLLALVGNLL
jgi:hypothetical protein